MAGVWRKGILLLVLAVLLVWGLAWGRRQAGALARAKIEIVDAQRQSAIDSLAVIQADSIVAAVEEANRIAADSIVRLWASIARDSIAGARLRREDSIARANAPPDSSALALPFWKATATRLDSELVVTRAEVRGLRSGWALAEATWRATAEADSIRWERTAALSETRRKLAEAALEAAGDPCRIPILGKCPSRPVVALIAIVGTAAALKL